MRFACARCHRTLLVPDTLAGEYVICTFCGAGNEVPPVPPLPVTKRCSDVPSKTLRYYAPPEMECSHCGCELDAVTENICPQCRQRFDPASAEHFRGLATDRQHEQMVWGFVIAIVAFMLLSVIIALGGS